MEIIAHLNMIPPTHTHQDKGLTTRYGKPVIYQRRESADTREAIRSRLIQYIPDQPLEGPLYAEINFFYPPTEMAKSKMEKKGMISLPKSTKPDLDNLAKQLLDVMQELGFYRNDSQIWDLFLTKIYHESPRIEIYISETNKFIENIDMY